MGFEDEVEQSFGRPCRQFERQVQADMRTAFSYPIDLGTADLYAMFGEAP